MLLLSRKLGEVVLIGDDIVVKVINIDPNTVMLGFEAPRDVPVVRKEIARTKKDAVEEGGHDAGE